MVSEDKTGQDQDHPSSPHPGQEEEDSLKGPPLKDSKVHKIQGFHLAMAKCASNNKDINKDNNKDINRDINNNNKDKDRDREGIEDTKDNNNKGSIRTTRPIKATKASKDTTKTTRNKDIKADPIRTEAIKDRPRGIRIRANHTHKEQANNPNEGGAEAEDGNNSHSHKIHLKGDHSGVEVTEVVAEETL